MFVYVNYRVEIDLLEDARAELVRSEVAMRFIDTKLASVNFIPRRDKEEEEGFDEGMTNRLDRFIIFYALYVWNWQFQYSGYSQRKYIVHKFNIPSKNVKVYRVVSTMVFLSVPSNRIGCPR